MTVAQALNRGYNLMVTAFQSRSSFNNGRCDCSHQLRVKDTGHPDEALGRSQGGFGT